MDVVGVQYGMSCSVLLAHVTGMQAVLCCTCSMLDGGSKTDNAQTESRQTYAAARVLADFEKCTCSCPTSI